MPTTRRKTSATKGPGALLNPAIARVSDAAGTAGLVTTERGRNGDDNGLDGRPLRLDAIHGDRARGSTPPLVTVPSVQAMENKRHMVAEIIVHFSGPVNAGGPEYGMYRLTETGRNDSSIAKNATVVKLASATYNAASRRGDSRRKRPFGLLNCVQVVIDGHQPGGLQDSFGRVINGNDDGRAGR